MMKTSGVRHQADKAARGVAQKTLNLKELSEFSVFDLDRTQQDKFAELAKNQYSSRSKLEILACEADKLFKSLSRDAFQGRL